MFHPILRVWMRRKSSASTPDNVPEIAVADNFETRERERERESGIRRSDPTWFFSCATEENWGKSSKCSSKSTLHCRRSDQNMWQNAVQSQHKSPYQEVHYMYGDATSTMSRYFLEHFWLVPPAVGLILQLLCSPIGNQNYRKKTKHRDLADASECR